MSELHRLIGDSADTLLWWQMVIRGVVVFGYLVALARLADRRAFGRLSVFDLVLGMVLGSTLSRAMTGNAPLLPTLATGVALVLMHRLLGRVSFSSDRLEQLIKGRKILLVEQGRPLPEALQRTAITERDLFEALHQTSAKLHLADVKKAYLERNGKISFIV